MALQKKPKAKDEIDLTAMKYFYDPKSIAIVGASKELYKISGKPIANLLKKGYQGKIYPINPRYSEIGGLVCYPSVLDVPGDIDMAIIGVPMEMVVDVIHQCGRKNVKTCVIFSAGYAEIGIEGRVLQKKLADAADEHGIKILGPNCFGLINVSNGVMATFSALPEEESSESGTLGFVSQSGLLGALLHAQALEEDIGFASYASVGNEANTEFSEFMSYMAKDDGIKVIGGYVEGAKSGGKFRKMAQLALEKGKPVVLIKGGSSEAGLRAAKYHTGSNAGDDRIYDAFFKQMGIVRMDYIYDILPFTKLFNFGRLPKSRNATILIGTGGVGIMMTDRLEKEGLCLPEIKGETLQKLEQYMPSFASGKNPVDMTTAPIGDITMMPKCLRAVVGDDSIDIILIGFFGNIEDQNYMHKSMEEIIGVHKTTDKLIVVVMEDKYLAPATRKLLKDAGVPQMQDEMQAAKALGKLAWYQERVTRLNSRSGEKTGGIPNQKAAILLASEGQPTGEQCRQILSAYGIPVSGEGLGKDAIKVLVRTQKDPVFGHVLTFSLGGLAGEALQDVTMRIAPLIRIDAEEMITENKGYHVLQGLQGKPQADINAIADIILKVSELVEDFKDKIKEVQINSLVVYAEGAFAEDAVIIKEI